MSQEKVQQLYMQLKMLEENAKQLQQQLQTIVQQQLEMKSTVQALEDFKGVKKGTPAFVPLSSGIFVKAIIQEPHELLVNVGAGTGVKKDIDSTQTIIHDQIKESEKLQQTMESQLEKFSTKAEELKENMKALLPQE